jgi:DNA-binding beta-propeller fold protein YncE
MGKQVRWRMVWALLIIWGAGEWASALEPSAKLVSRAGYRGPVDLVVADDESWLVTVNELAHSLSLIDLKTRQVVDELACAGRPAGCAKLPGDELLVSCREAGFVRRIAVRRNSSQELVLREIATIEVGYEPLGLAIDTRRMRAYVGLVASAEAAEIDLTSNALIRRLNVGKWPRYLAVSPDGNKLAVGLSGQSAIGVFDLPSGEPAYEEPLSGGINLGLMRCSQDGQYVYFPWMIYRSNPIDPGNIRRGWVLASRVARVRLDGPATREAISLDVPRLAVADPHGLAITPDEAQMAVTSAGTHEVLVYRLKDVPFIGAGGPGDLIDPRLLRDNDAFYRIPVGGRPLGIEAGSDNRSLYIVNHTLDALQIVDLDQRQLTASIAVGTPPNDSAQRMVHRGREIFHDAGRSLDQWYSCRSCHLDGGSNAKAMDTWNDGTELTPKTVLPLNSVTETGPWTWHGWQNDLDESIQNSFVSTMQGQSATEEDVAAVRAYLSTLRPNRSPYLVAALAADSPTAKLVEAGKKLFHSSSVGCADCHAGPHFTDGQIHDVGLGNAADTYQGFNTPSLVGVYTKVRLLHDGRAKSLENVLTQWHTPSEIGGGAELTAEQLEQLVAYLKTL